MEGIAVIYESRDKIVIKIDEVDASYLNKGRDLNFYHDQVLGKLEDFQPAEWQLSHNSSHVFCFVVFTRKNSFHD